MSGSLSRSCASRFARASPMVEGRHPLVHSDITTPHRVRRPRTMVPELVGRTVGGVASGTAEVAHGRGRSNPLLAPVGGDEAVERCRADGMHGLGKGAG